MGAIILQSAHRAKGVSIEMSDYGFTCDPGQTSLERLSNSQILNLNLSSPKATTTYKPKNPPDPQISPQSPLNHQIL